MEEESKLLILNNKRNDKVSFELKEDELQVEIHWPQSGGLLHYMDINLTLGQAVELKDFLNNNLK